MYRNRKYTKHDEMRAEEEKQPIVGVGGGGVDRATVTFSTLIEGRPDFVLNSEAMEGRELY